MSSDNILDKVKKLRELTGVGFKDCKNALDENSCDNLFQFPIGKNRVVVTKKDREIIVRDIFSSNGTTINIDLP